MDLKQIGKNGVLVIVYTIFSNDNRINHGNLLKLSKLNLQMLNSRLVELKEHGFITDEPKTTFGGERIIRLTERGIKLAMVIEKIKKL
jgi:DNA-binding HxlR family transcriptional regulator